MSLHVDPVPADPPFDTEALLAHVGWVRRLAHGLLPADPHLAEDLAQQTYLTALEKKPSTDRSLSSWLATVLANLKRQERRGSGRRAVRERSVARAEAQPGDVDHDATLAMHHELVQSVRSLAEPYRETIVLRYFEELSPTAIARKQNVPVATVKARLARALEQLRVKLDRSHGGDGRAWIAALIPFSEPGAGVGIAAMGALIMGTKLKIAAAVVVVLALVTVLMLRRSSIDRTDAPVADGSRVPAITEPNRTNPLATGGSGSDRAPAPTDSAAVTTKDLDVLVVDEAGSAITDTPVMLLDAQDASQGTRTDPTGHAGFRSHPGRGALFVHRSDDAPRRVELETSAGARHVQLPPMAELSGFLRENGRPPATAIMIVMLSRERLFPCIELPNEVRTFLGLEDDERYRLDKLTETDGTFRYRGLPDSWSGRLVLLPRTWAVVDPKLTSSGNEVVVLNTPVKNLAIEVEHRSHLSGRIVDANHQPSDRARIKALLEWSEHRSETNETVSWPDGRFEIALGRNELEQVTLDVVDREVRGTTKLVRRRTEIGADFDLGDIVLVTGSTLRLHVTDAEGRPIAAALAFAEDFSPQTRTDAKGDCELTDVPAIARRVRVIAKGCWGATVPLPAGPDPMTLALQPCNRLTIRALCPDGRAPGSIRIAISSSTSHLFPDMAGDAVGRIMPERMIGKFNQTGSDGAGREETCFTPDDSGTLAIEAVIAGAPLRVRIQDALGRIGRETTVLPLGEREERNVEIVLDRAPHLVRGIVRDETGAPVPGASVEARAQRSLSASAKTDSAGRFEFDPTFAEAIELGVRKEGFALVQQRGILLHDPPADIAITLEHGRRVRVSVVDTSSRPVDAGNLSVFDPLSYSGWPSRTLSPGLFDVDGLPGHDIELRLYLSGKQYVQTHDPRVPEARIEVPVHGRVVVAWSSSTGEDHAVTLVPMDTTLGELISFSSEKPNGEAVFESVLPGEWYVSLLSGGKVKSGRKVEETITVQPDVTVRIELQR